MTAPNHRLEQEPVVTPERFRGLSRPGERPALIGTLVFASLVIAFVAAVLLAARERSLARQSSGIRSPSNAAPEWVWYVGR